jgi:4-amino-4-deoxy-L-arabinose transferase-like glycosyltransferase
MDALTDSAAMAAAPPASGARAPGARSRLRRVWRAALPPLLFLLAAVLLRSLTFLQAVFDTDEGLYIVQAREWLRGNWPIVAIWDMHPVGAPAMFAAAFAVFGQSMVTVRLLAILCVTATAWAIFGLVRAAGAPRTVGLGAGMIYLAFSVRLGGAATNTEILFAPFVVLALAVGVAGTRGVLALGEAPRTAQLIGMGLAMGCAFAIKPVVTPEGCLAFALLTFPALAMRLLPVRRFLLWALAYAGLVLVPTALLGLAYALRGELMAFLDGSFFAPFRYSLGRLPLPEAIRYTAVTALTLIWPIALAALAVMRWGGRRGTGGRLTRIGLIWFGCATIAVVGPGFFFQHYFLMWLPPLAVLAGLGAWVFARIARPGWRRFAYALTIGAVVIHSWLGAFVPRLDRGIGIALPDPVQEVAAAIRQELAPGETIFIANYHPVVYFLAGAEVPTRYIFPAQLTGNHYQVTGIDPEEEVRRILGTQPRMIVVDRGWWWSIRPEAATLIEAALSEDYELAETVAEERGPVEIWRRR